MLRLAFSISIYCIVSCGIQVVPGQILRSAFVSPARFGQSSFHWLGSEDSIVHCLSGHWTSCSQAMLLIMT